MSLPPYANCGFELCDLPGQCQYEGKCHHPAKHSKDEITLSITEYEQMRKDAERYAKLKDLALTPQTSKSFAISKFNGMHWDSYEGGIIDLDVALDQAITKDK